MKYLKIFEQFEEGWDPFGEEFKKHNIVIDLLRQLFNKYYIGRVEDMRKAYSDDIFILYTEEDDRYVLYFYLNIHWKLFEGKFRERYKNPIYYSRTNYNFAHKITIMK